jgi:hypothetical protein
LPTLSWGGARTDSAEYHLVDKEASRFLGRFPPGGGHKVRMSETEGVVETPPLANRRLTAVGDSQWYVAWSDAYDVAVYSPMERRSAVFAVPTDPRGLTRPLRTG